MPPAIVLSGGLRMIDNHQNWRVPIQYTEAVRLSGGLPVLGCGGDPGEMAAAFDGLLLTGGVDIDPQYFGEQPVNGTLDIDRHLDEVELGLFRAFLEAGKPIFGICRGYQVINVALGGSLWQDLPAQKGIQHSRVTHEVHMLQKGLLTDTYGERFRTNSYHHQALKAIADGFETVAEAPDGTVEASILRGRPVWGVQWHPERMTGAYADEGMPDMKCLFDRFVAVCRGEGTDGGLL